jgi:hypothetical protein
MNNKFLNRFRKIETIKATFLIFIPLILISASGETRESISDYIYSDVRDLFVGLLSFAAAMFIYNGVVNNKWYNIALGFSLVAISLTPHYDLPIMHYASAGLFFLGSIVVMIFYSSAKQRIYKIIAGFFIILAMSLHFVFDTFSLLIAEWIGLIPISLHFILETNNKID